MKSLFHKYERTFKILPILNKNTKSVVLEYLKCTECKKPSIFEIPDIECLYCLFQEKYRMARNITEEREIAFSTLNIIKKMMLSEIKSNIKDSTKDLTDYIECLNNLEFSQGSEQDAIIFWSQSITNFIKDTNKIPNKDELENIIYSW